MAEMSGERRRLDDGMEKWSSRGAPPTQGRQTYQRCKESGDIRGYLYSLTKMAFRVKQFVREMFNKQALYINFCMLGLSAAMAIFMTYQMKIFEEKYQISLAYFSIAQTLFLVWNAINDPLFGYAQDVGCGIKWIMDRRKVILYVGPALSFSVLLFYFPWTRNSELKWVIGMQYFISLFIYDSLMTLMVSAYCGMCIESGKKQTARVRVLVYSEFAELIGGLAVYPVSSLSKNLDNFQVFQMLSVIISFVAAGGCILTGVFCDTKKFQLRRAPEDSDEEDREEQSLLASVVQSLRVSWQALKQRNFVCAVVGQFFRYARVSFISAFVVILVEHLVSPNGLLVAHSHSLSIYLTLARILPRVLFILLWPLSSQYGAWVMNTLIGGCALINCIVAFTIGSNNPISIAVFLVLESMFAGCGQESFYMLFIGSVVDDDMVINRRKAPISAVLFTLKALMNKPAEQLTNIFTTNILALGGYDLIRGHYACTNWYGNYALLKLPEGDPAVSFDAPRVNCSTVVSTMFHLAVTFPFLCAFFEIIIMVFFEHRFPGKEEDTEEDVAESEEEESSEEEAELREVTAEAEDWFTEENSEVEEVTAKAEDRFSEEDSELQEVTAKAENGFVEEDSEIKEITAKAEENFMEEDSDIKDAIPKAEEEISEKKPLWIGTIGKSEGELLEKKPLWKASIHKSEGRVSEEMPLSKDAHIKIE